MSAVFSLLFVTSVHAASPEACGPGSSKSDKSFRVTGTGIEMKAAPKASAAKLINEKASSVMKSTQYLTIDNSVTVIEECSQGGWSRVRVSEPDYLRASHVGWVPSSVLRGRDLDASGNESFTDKDFTWDKRTRPHKEVIMAGVNKMHRENPRCKDIDPSSADLSPSKGTPRDPVFFVVCGKGAGVFTAFSPSRTY